MSKRGAGTGLEKGGEFPIANLPPERVAKAATAAQMAARKLKDPRSRVKSGVTPSGSPFLSSQLPTSPFVGTTGAQQQTPQSQQPVFVGVNGAPTFGQTQSFPGIQAPTTGFNFNAPNGSSSLSFGAQPVQNLFSSLGNNNNNQGTPNFGNVFQTQNSAQGNVQSDGDMVMDSPEKQRPSGVGGVDAQTTNATFASNIFGQPQTQQNSFGQSSSTSDTTGFGQNQNNAQSAFSQARSGFAQNRTNNESGFSQALKYFEQTQPATQSPFLQPTTHLPSIGQSQTTLQPQALQPTAPSFSFHPNQPSQPNGGFGFQSGSKTEQRPQTSPFEPATTAPQTFGGIFGQPTSTSNNLFGQPAMDVQQSQAPQLLFGQSNETPQPTNFNPAPVEHPQPQFNFAAAPTPFEGFQMQTSPNPSSVFTPAAFAPEVTMHSNSTPSDPSPPSPKPGPAEPALFAFDPAPTYAEPQMSSNTGHFNIQSQAQNAATPPSSLFHRISAPTPPQQENETLAGGVFGHGPTFVVEEPVLLPQTQVGSLLGRVSRSEPQPEPGQQDVQAPVTGLFDQGSRSKSPVLEARLENPEPSMPRGYQDANQTNAVQPADRVEEYPRAQQPLFMQHEANKTPFASLQPQALGSLSTSTAALKSSGFAPEFPTPPAPSATSISSSTQPSARPVPQESASLDPLHQGENVKIRMRSHGSSDLPDEDIVEHDRVFRIRSLNTQFQKTLAKIDPGSSEIDTLVRFYVAQRESIGASLGLQRQDNAGSKRKERDEQTEPEVENASKRARLGDNVSGFTPTGTFDPVANSGSTTSQQSPAHTATRAQNNTTGTGSQVSNSTTSNLFENMISSPALSASTSQKPASPPKRKLFQKFPSSTQSNSEAMNTFASQSTSSAEPSRVTLAETAGPSPTNLFQSAASSSTPAKSPSNTSTFEVPKFGTGSGASFMDAFAAQSKKSAAALEAEAKRKRKAEDFDSDEDDEAEWERKYEEEQRAKRNKIESLTRSGPSGFQPNVSNTRTEQSNIFSPTASKGTTLNPADTIADVGNEMRDLYDTASTGQEGSRSSQDEEESSPESQDQEDDDEDQDETYDPDAEQDTNDEPGDHEEQESDEEDIPSIADDSAKGKSLFERIKPNPKLNSNGSPKTGEQDSGQHSNEVKPNPFTVKSSVGSTKPSHTEATNSFKPIGRGNPFGLNNVSSTPNAPTMSPFTPINGIKSTNPTSLGSSSSLFSPKSSFKAEPKQVTPFEKATENIFSSTPRSADSASVLSGGGMTLMPGPIPGEGLFGSRPSTPNNAEATNDSVVGNLGKVPSFSPQGDNTWKAGTPIKFGTPTKITPTQIGPQVNIMAATPPAKEDNSSVPNNYGDLFGAASTRPGATSLSEVGFGFGGPTAPLLLNPSIQNSVTSSRDTSPGATDTESLNTDAEDQTNDPQSDLMQSRPGEENEEVLFSHRSKVLKYVSEEAAAAQRLAAGYNTMGVGQLRVLKHKETGKTRLLLRADPGSNIIVNTALVSSMTYKSVSTKGSGTVKFGIPIATGIEHWVIKIKTQELAEQLSGVLQANK